LVLGVVLLYLLSVTFIVVAAAGNDKSKSDNDNNNKKETCEEDGTCVEDVADAAITNAAADTATKTNATTTNDTNSANCKDEDSESNCFVWAVAGECEKNPAYMTQKCQMSCGICNGGYVIHILL
jgi:hypothetical protein